MSNEDSARKKPYNKPKARVVEMNAEETLASSCVATGQQVGGRSGFACDPSGGCFDSGS